MKNQYSKFIATAAVAAMALPVAAQADIKFQDVKATDYFYEDVQSLVERGIVKGYAADETFRPYAEVTRGQAAKMIAGALQLDTSNVTNPNFKDVPTTHEFYGYIAALANKGIISGYADTQTFNPNAPMTRYQMAKVIALAFDLQPSEKATPFTDVSGSQANYVQALYANNITNGTTDTTYGGFTHVKRGQLASFIVRAEKAVAKEMDVKETEKDNVTITTPVQQHPSGGNTSNTGTNTTDKQPTTPDAEQSETPEQTAPTGEPLSGTVQFDGDTVKVGDKVVDVTATFQTLFSNKSALNNTDMTVRVEDGKVIAVEQVTINGEGTFDAGNAAIEQMTINADNVTLKNATITGDVLVSASVQQNLTFDHVDIQGEVRDADPKTATVRGALLAALDGENALGLEEAQVTRLKITFANSKVAYIEIAKGKPELTFDRQTTVTAISVKTDTSISADPDVILPNLMIAKGVMNLELNMSVASVEIESSNVPVEITGKANLGSVTVKEQTEGEASTAPAVVLKTEGTVQEIKSDVPVTLGDNLLVGATKNAAGDEVDAAEIIANIEDVKEKVNVAIEEDDLANGIAAKLIANREKYGYVKLYVLNAGERAVYYRIVEDYSEYKLPKTGEAVPVDAIAYQTGDEFVAWFDKGIQVFVAGENGKIEDSYVIQSRNINYMSFINHTVKDGQFVVQSVYNDALKLNKSFIAKGDQFIWFGEKGENLTGDVPTYKVDLPKELTGLFGQEIGYGDYAYGISVSKTIGGGSGSTSNGADDEQTAITVINELVNAFDDVNNTQYYFEYYLTSSIYRLFDYNYNALHDILFEKYVEQLSATKVTSKEDVVKRVTKVNEENAALVEAYEAADKAADALFKLDRYSYEDYEALADDISEEKIAAAEKAYAVLLAFKATGKQIENNVNSIRYEIEEAKRLVERKESAGQIVELAKAYIKNPTTNDEFMNELDNIAYEVVQFGHRIEQKRFAYPIYVNEYAKAISELQEVSRDAIREAVRQVNNAQTATATIEAWYEKFKDVRAMDYYDAPAFDKFTIKDAASLQMMLQEVDEAFAAVNVSNASNYINEMYDMQNAIEQLDYIEKMQADDTYVTTVTGDERAKFKRVMGQLFQNTSYNTYRSALIDQYVAKLVNVETVTAANLVQIMQDVNAEQADTLTQLNSLLTEAKALFTSDYYSIDNLNSDVTEQTVAALEEKMSEWSKKGYNIEEVSYIVTSAKEALTNLATIAKLPETLQTTSESWSSEANTIHDVVNYNAQGRYTNTFNYDLYKFYQAEIVKADKMNVETLRAIIASVNEQHKDYKAQVQSIQQRLNAATNVTEDGQYTMTKAEFDQLIQDVQAYIDVYGDNHNFAYEAKNTYERFLHAQSTTSLLNKVSAAQIEDEYYFTLSFSENVNIEGATVTIDGVATTIATAPTEDGVNNIEIRITKEQYEALYRDELRIVPTLTIEGVTDMNGQAIEFSNIPLAYSYY